MSKTIPLISIAIVLLLCGCRQASFLKQRYTHYGHVKPVVSNERHTNKQFPREQQPLLVQTKVETAPSPRQGRPINSEEHTPLAPHSVPVRRDPHPRDVTASAGHVFKNTLSGGWSVGKMDVLTVKSKVSFNDNADRIPVISPLLRIVFLLLLIALVVLVIFLVMLL
jgi:hypothetical protein